MGPKAHDVRRIMEVKNTHGRSMLATKGMQE